MTTAQPHTLSIADRVSIWIDNDLITRIAGTFAVTAITNTTFSYLQAGDDFAEQESTGFMAGISPTHKPDARYWIPTENEWYKAAYYDPGPGGPVDDYWWFPWRNDTDLGHSANYYNGTYAETGRPNPVLFRTHLSDVRQGVPTYYGTVQQAGNVEEWTEGDEFSAGPHSRGGHWNGPATEIERIMSFSGYPRWTTVGGSMLGFRVATLGLNIASVNLGNYRYLRYRGPNGSHGNVAEISFYRNGVKLTGTGFGTPGSWAESGATFERALDGDFATFFDAPTSDGAYVGMDTR